MEVRHCHERRVVCGGVRAVPRTVIKTLKLRTDLHRAWLRASRTREAELPLPSPDPSPAPMLFWCKKEKQGPPGEGDDLCVFCESVMGAKLVRI